MSAEEVQEQIENLTASVDTTDAPETVSKENARSVSASFAYRLDSDHHRRKRGLLVINVEQAIEEGISFAKSKAANLLASHVLDPQIANQNRLPQDFHMLCYSIAQISIQMKEGADVVLHSRTVLPSVTKRTIRPPKLVFENTVSSKLYMYVEKLHALNLALDRLNLSVFATILECSEHGNLPSTIDAIATRTEYAPATIKKSISELKRILGRINVEIIKENENYIVVDE